MKQVWSKATTLWRKNPVAVSAAGVVLVVVAGWLLFGRGEEGPQTLVVGPNSFVQSVSVSGTVTPAKSVELGFAQSGRITGVYATVGQTVSQWALLAQTENGDLRAAVVQREATLENQRAKLVSLQAGTRPEEIAVAQAQVKEDESALTDQLHEAYTTADDAVRNQADQFIQNPATTPDVLFDSSDSAISNRVEIGRAALEQTLRAWSTSLTGDTQNDPAAAAQGQKALVATVAFLADANAALNRAITNPDNTQAIIDGYIADISAARTSVNAALSAVNAADTRLATDRRSLELKQAGATLQDISAQAAQVKAAQADLDAARANLAKTLIVAPFSGIVTRVDAKVGSITSQSSSAMALISAGTFQIESYVPEINISKLEVGDKGTVTLDAYGEDSPFEAVVLSIDPAQTVRDGVSTYRAILQFVATDTRIRSGMTANITIETDKREGVIAVPQGAVTAREGKKYVRVLEEGVEVERPVTTGEVSSQGDIEVLSGLVAGDVVVLSPAK